MNDETKKQLTGILDELRLQLAMIAIEESTHAEKNRKIGRIIRNIEAIQRIFGLHRPNDDVSDIPF